MRESFDDWDIEEKPDPPRPSIHAMDGHATGQVDGPYFYSAEDVERFIVELRAASGRVFAGDPAESQARSASRPEHTFEPDRWPCIFPGCEEKTYLMDGHLGGHLFCTAGHNQDMAGGDFVPADRLKLLTDYLAGREGTSARHA